MKYKFRHIIEKLLWGIILLLLVFPMIQEQYSYWEKRSLNGVIKKKENPDFRVRKFLKGDFQKEKEAYLNQNFGFRNDLVRIKNQIDYRLFNKANAKSVIIGKDDYLFEEAYLKAAVGSDYIGDTKIWKKAKLLKEIQDTLNRSNTKVIVLFAPGKGTFFPEYIPDQYYKKQQPKTNAKIYQQAFDSLNIAYLDLNQWFFDIKDTAPYPLYPKCGIHWSEYGQYRAIDTIIKYVENIQQINLPDIVLDSVNFSNANNKGEEIDIGAGMNLWNEIPTYPLADPKIHYKKDATTQQISAMVIADSYYWGLYRHRLSKEIFNKGEFWFYNREIYPSKKGVAKKCKNIDLIPYVENQDIVFILQTNATLTDFGFGFIERLHKTYFTPSKTKSISKEKNIQYFKNKIYNTPEWIEKTKKKAKQFNLPLEEMIQKDAEYMFQQQQKKKKK